MAGSALDYYRDRYAKAAGKVAAIRADAVARFQTEVRTFRGYKAVQELLDTLSRWRSLLGRWQALLAAMGTHATAQEHERFALSLAQYEDHAVPFYADAQCTDGTDCLGAVPVVAITVGTVAVGVAGAAWALAYASDALVGYQRSEAGLRELEIRWEAVQKGLVPATVLTQPSTQPAPAVPTKPPSPDELLQTGLTVLGVGVVVGTAGALAWWALGSKR